MSAIARSILGVALLAFSGCATPWDSGYRPSAAETVDIFTAVIRARLSSNPLPRHRKLEIFIDFGVVPGLSAQFLEYAVTLHSGSAGSSPPHTRWYSLRMGQFTPENVFVLARGSGAGYKIVELRKRNGQWTIMREDDFVLL
jgi:hypothetical protein